MESFCESFVTSKNLLPDIFKCKVVLPNLLPKFGRSVIFGRRSLTKARTNAYDFSVLMCETFSIS